MRDGKRNSKSKTETFTSASGLSALAPPFNFNSKTHDYEPSFDYNLEGVYDFSHVCDDSFENGSNSYLFLDGDAAATSMAYNSIFKLDENTLYSSEINFSQVQEIGASGDNTTLLLRELCFSESLDYCSDAAVNKENDAGRLSEVDVCADATVVKGKKYSSVDPSVVMELHVLQNATDMMACHKKILMDKDKDKEKQNCETVINEAIVVGKEDPSPALPDEFKLQSHNGESFVPVQASFVMSDTNDSDLDSPCWKGTGFCQSVFRDPGPIVSKLPKIEGDSRKSLNPLAPHFFPGSAKPLVDYHGNKFEENDSSSFKKDTSSVTLSSEEHRLTAFVKAGISSSEVSNAIETRFSNDTHDAGKEYPLPKKLNTNSLLNTSFSDGPFLAREDLTFNGQDVTGANVSGSVKAAEPAILNSTNVYFSPTGNLSTSIFPRDGAFSHFCETLRGASKSTTPKMDVQLVINTIHDLSELLRWNCSNDLSLNEHERDMIHRIIDNLYVCIANKVQQRVSIAESGHPCTSYCPVKLPDCHKVTKIKSVTVAHDWETQKSLSANSHKKVLVSSSSSSRSDEGIKIGDDVPRLQTIGKALKELKIVEEMHPRPLLNGDLWPDASDAPFL